MLAATHSPVILPSETQSREFDAKLLLACHLAERGHPVVVGSRIAIHNRIHALPRGLYLAKDIRGSSRRMFRIMDKLGFAIAAWDEEAIVVTDRATYHERRVDTENLNRIKAFLAWGAHNRELIESAPGYRGTPVYETGNPRIDLLTPRCRRLFDPEVAALRARFGEFILINSNFGRINHFLNSQAAKRTAGGGYTNLGAGTQEWWSFRYAVFDGLRAMIPALATAFPERYIVIRPHPSEAHEVWREAARGLPNVTVIHEGNVHPWIMASAAAIHNGCTTGLESYLLDHPVIAYHPVTSEKYDNQLPNRVSAPVFSESELLAVLADFLGGAPLPPCSAEARALAEDQVGSLDGPLSCERIDELIADQGRTWLAPRPSFPDRIEGYARSVSRQAVKTVNSYRRGHKSSRGYSAHRFPGLSAAHVGERLACLSDLVGRFADLKVRQIYPNIFVISKVAR